MINQVIVPLDLSDLSESAIPLARFVARSRGVPLTLVHVVDVSPDLASFLDARSGTDELQDLTAQGEEHLKQVAATIDDVEVGTVVLRGRAAPALVEYADGFDEPLIVMSSHGRSGWRLFTVGSVLAKVVHAASCPVLVARYGDEEQPAPPADQISRVLVPLDGSEFGEHALHAAERLLPEAGVTFHLVRIPEAAVYPSTMYGSASYEGIEMYMDAMESEAEDYLKRVAADLESRGRNATWEVRQGPTPEAIKAAAADFEAGLIAMSSHGRTGFRRVLMGSIAERVLKESAVPVLMVGPEDEGD